MSSPTDIFNRLPSVSEDTLHYTIHLPAAIQDKVSATSLAACILNFTSTLLPTFLWHRDSFQLKVIPDPDSGPRENKYVLEGRMRIGDCVDDEWCVVWLLREISSRWEVVISVNDSDGEFLLIEAADFLPSWVNPSNAPNRVWIYSGRLHLIPLLHVSAPNKPRRHLAVKQQNDFGTALEENDEDFIAVDDSLRIVRDACIYTLAPKEVEDTVWRRVSGYPGAAERHMHTTKAYLPVDIARALSIDPSLVQKAVETFYTRDAIQLRAAHRMAGFPPRPNVLRNVRMTRTAYAQLTGQRFYPPRIFGQFEEPEGTDAWRWRDIGMKLACGFEMLYQESKCRLNITTEKIASSSEARKDVLHRTPEYRSFISKLVSYGYFHDELEGSQLWRELEDKASEVYVEALRTSELSRPSFTTQFNLALSRANEAITDDVGPEDSDEWMNVDNSSFDAMLIPSVNNDEPDVMNIDSNEEEGNRLAQKESERLHDLASKVEQFVQGQGDLEGARFEDEASSDDDDADSDQQTVDTDEKAPEGLTGDEVARQQAMAKLVPPLPAAEYGQMPASFNSQRVAKTTIENETLEIPTESANKEAIFTRPIRPPLLPRDKYEGVDSDDESSSSDPLAGDEDEYESEEDRPQVVGEVEIDMTEEQDEFIEFSRQTLGISDNMWNDIIQERIRRGAFVPKHPKFDKKRGQVQQAEPEIQSTKTPSSEGALRTPVSGARPNANPNLDSFEAVMEAMDSELKRLHQPEAAATRVSPISAADKGKGKGPVSSPDTSLDIEAAMEAELHAALEKGDSEDQDETPLDYNLIKNFLESFKSQAGLSGPVSNLAGRLMPEWKMPRDDV
ncbi:SGT1 protein-domain-containing protein [Pisolithus croceorrhizus]|nr:SGT1 protein-domain-containing protein [Pisolithus croceorrhizus]